MNDKNIFRYKGSFLQAKVKDETLIFDPYQSKVISIFAAKINVHLQFLPFIYHEKFVTRDFEKIIELELPVSLLII